MGRDGRKLGASLGGEVGCSFPGDEETSEDGILRPGVFKKLLVRLSGDIALNDLHGPEDCPKGMRPA